MKLLWRSGKDTRSWKNTKSLCGCLVFMSSTTLGLLLAAVEAGTTCHRTYRLTLTPRNMYAGVFNVLAWPNVQINRAIFSTFSYGLYLVFLCCPDCLFVFFVPRYAFYCRLLKLCTLTSIQTAQSTSTPRE